MMLGRGRKKADATRAGPADYRRFAQ